ncbi:BF2992 family fimbrillin-A clan protein [Bacteroides sp. AN502(2024)]|uniref:BF2992 family fimbrillin-A clan protein n=1 Tax=Bacteroides sp. AN502(2024) TaxID=3160599 RepID=UPI0035134F6C
MNSIRLHIYQFVVTMLLLPLLCACDGQDVPDPNGGTVPEGMVEIRPVLPGMFSAIPRDPGGVRSVASRAYDSDAITESKLDTNKLERLPHGSTVWLIVKSKVKGQATATYVKKSYVVFNPLEGDMSKSYLVPCTVNDNGDMLDMEGSPLYLKKGQKYMFYAISPARKLDEEKLARDTVGFKVKNGEYFYANDCRYASTTPDTIEVESSNPEDVQIIKLRPMMNQTAELKFQIDKGVGVHDLDIQPSGIRISGLQNDTTKNAVYGGPDGLHWHMSQSEGDDPIDLQHGDKVGMLDCYDYTIDTDERVNIEVPVLPMYSTSKPVIVIFRLKVNGVPTSYEMMLNEKDFKAGYSYGYRGKVSIEEGVTVVTWQFVSWEYDVNFPF